jgi:hypothetical protein
MQDGLVFDLDSFVKNQNQHFNSLHSVQFLYLPDPRSVRPSMISQGELRWIHVLCGEQGFSVKIGS